MSCSPEDNKRLYNLAAEKYDSNYLEGVTGLYHRKFETDIVSSMLKVRNKKVLDIGTGTGRFAVEFSERAREVIGIDVSESMIEKAGFKAKDRKNLKFIVMDVNKMDFENNSFDCASIIGAFEFIKDMRPMFREVKRVLKPGGELIFTCFNRNSLFGILPRRHITESHGLNEINKTLREEGFLIKGKKSAFFVPFQIVFKVNSLLRFKFPREVWFRIVIFIESCFLRSRIFEDKGMQFIILCKKT